MTRSLTALVAVVAFGAALLGVPTKALAAGGQVRGGDLFLTRTGGRCAVGFTVVSGFVTSGRCGRAGDPALASTGVVMGVFQTSSFPGNDYAWVRLNPGWTPVGEVRRYPGVVAVTGVSSAPVGAAVCRSGPTTGWRCGTVTAKNATIVYPEGTVSGLTRTTACAGSGDTGGPFLAGTLAQGLLSGGSGNCSTGGTTYFQPIGEILAAFGLTLLTA